MINAIKIFFSSQSDAKSIDLVVGQDGVKKIFPNKENPRNIVILHDDGIVEYGNVDHYIAMKDYKKNEA